jgi:hypothetical protein
VIVFDQISLMVASCLTVGLFTFWRGRASLRLAIPLAAGVLSCVSEFPSGYSSSFYFLVLCVYAFIPCQSGFRFGERADWRTGYSPC